MEFPGHVLTQHNPLCQFDAHYFIARLFHNSERMVTGIWTLSSPTRRGGVEGARVVIFNPQTTLVQSSS